MKETLTNAARIGGSVLLVTAVALVAVVAAPGLVGAEGSYTVLSGSMEPTLQPGDVVVVQSASPADVQKGDVITFTVSGEFGGPGRDRVTHRVVAKHQTADGVVYRTKGDANADRDPWTVSHSQVIGTVWFSIPYAALVLRFARSALGQALLVVLPGVLLIGSGIRTFYRAATNPEADA